MRLFNIEVRNKAPKMGKGTIETLIMENCKQKSLKDLVLAIAEFCHEDEDDDFIDLKIIQLKNDKSS